MAEGKGYFQLISESLATFINRILYLAMGAVVPIDSFNLFLYHLLAHCLPCV